MATQISLSGCSGTEGHHARSFTQRRASRGVLQELGQRGVAKTRFDGFHGVVESLMKRTELSAVSANPERALANPLERLDRFDDVPDRQFLGALGEHATPLGAAARGEPP